MTIAAGLSPLYACAEARPIHFQVRAPSRENAQHGDAIRPAQSNKIESEK
jgi:hypothetical protein